MPIKPVPKKVGRRPGAHAPSLYIYIYIYILFIYIYIYTSLCIYIYIYIYIYLQGVRSPEIQVSDPKKGRGSPEIQGRTRADQLFPGMLYNHVFNFYVIFILFSSVFFFF